jgi:hypothetical protein
VTIPPRKPRYTKTRAFPLGTATDGSCDDGVSKPGSPWTHQTEALHIDPSRDYLIAADLKNDPMAGERELFNIKSSLNLRNLIYVGVHENSASPDSVDGFFFFKLPPPPPASPPPNEKII